MTLDIFESNGQGYHFRNIRSRIITLTLISDPNVILRNMSWRLLIQFNKIVPDGDDFMSSTVKYQRFDLIRCKEIDGVRSGAEERVRVLGAEAAEREARTNGVERELRLEREWRTSLQETSICNTEKISQLHQEIDQLKRVSEVRYRICIAF